jgi:hypothetical protein
MYLFSKNIEHPTGLPSLAIFFPGVEELGDILIETNFLARISYDYYLVLYNSRKLASSFRRGFGCSPLRRI